MRALAPLAAGMDSQLEHEIGDAERVALNYAPPRLRAKLAAYFALDRRLAQIVANTSEPMLGQLRLAWWREMLAKPARDRPHGDVVLDAVSSSYEQSAHELDPLIDAWEAFLLAETLTKETISAFADQRVAPIRTVFELSDATGVGAVLWALADTAAHMSDEHEQTTILEVARPLCDSLMPLPRTMRTISILSALAKRSVRRGGRPLFGGEGSFLIAFRASIIGK